MGSDRRRVDRRRRTAAAARRASAVTQLERARGSWGSRARRRRDRRARHGRRQGRGRRACRPTGPRSRRGGRGELGLGGEGVPGEVGQVDLHHAISGGCHRFGLRTRRADCGGRLSAGSTSRVDLADLRRAAGRAQLVEEVHVRLRVGRPLLGDVVLVVDRLDRAHRLARSAVDALVRVDVEHPAALVDAVHRALFDARLVEQVDAGLGDHVRHGWSSTRAFSGCQYVPRCRFERESGECDEARIGSGILDRWRWWRYRTSSSASGWRCGTGSASATAGRSTPTRSASSERTDDGAVLVETRRGPVRVDRAAVVAVRAVPPAPSTTARLPRSHGWRPSARTPGPPWSTGRSAPGGCAPPDGFTGRANGRDSRSGTRGCPSRQRSTPCAPSPASTGSGHACRSRWARRGTRRWRPQGWVLDVAHARGAEVAVLVGAAAGHPRPARGAARAPVRRMVAAGARRCSRRLRSAHVLDPGGRPSHRVRPDRRPGRDGIGAARATVVEDHLHVSLLEVAPVARRRGSRRRCSPRRRSGAASTARAGRCCRSRCTTRRRWRSTTGSATWSTTSTATSCRRPAEPARSPALQALLGLTRRRA